MTLNNARSAVAEAESLLGRWEAAVTAKTLELESLQERAGADVVAAGVDGDERAAELARAIGSLRTELEVATAAVTSATGVLDEARRAVLRAGVAQARQLADEKRSEAAQRQVRTDELLAALSEHEGCDFAPAVRLVQGTLGMIEVPSVTQTAQLLEEATRIEAETATVEQASDGHVLPVAQYLKHLRVVDPAGPEAIARAAENEERDATAARVLADRQALWARRDAWLAQRAERIARPGADPRFGGDLAGHYMEGTTREGAAQGFAKADLRAARDAAFERGVRGDEALLTAALDDLEGTLVGAAAHE